MVGLEHWSVSAIIDSVEWISVEHESTNYL